MVEPLKKKVFRVGQPLGKSWKIFLWITFGKSLFFCGQPLPKR